MEPGRDIDWERTLILFGIGLGVLLSLGKVWYGVKRCFRGMALWSGRKILKLIQDHPAEFREYVLKVFGPEFVVAAQRDTRIAKLEDDVMNLAAEMGRDRQGVESAMKTVAEKIEMLADAHWAGNRMLQTVLGAVLGGEAQPEIQRRLIEASERDADEGGEYRGPERRRKPRKRG